MMHIKYKLEKSELHGIGLFTDQSLKKDQLVYTASSILDTNITQEQFDNLSEEEKREIRYWGFFIPETNMWHADFDVTRFVNHSFKATLTQDPKHKDAYLVATRDLAKGEELTQNYLEFETREDLAKRGISM